MTPPARDADARSNRDILGLPEGPPVPEQVDARPDEPVTRLAKLRELLAEQDRLMAEAEEFHDWLDSFGYDYPGNEAWAEMMVRLGRL